MRRPLATLAAASLAFTLVAVEGQDETALPDPIDVTMYFHGDDNTQTIDEDAYAVGENSGILEMDRDAPVDNSYETKAITNYVQGPNARCAGNGLLPVWVGFLDGTIDGFATVDFRVLGGTGGDVVIDVFTDVTGQACNEAYPEPAGSVTVALPAAEGLVSAVIDLDGVTADTSLMVQIRGVDSENSVENPVGNPGAPIWPGRIAPTDPTAQGRIVYDGTSFLSNISFTCQPDMDDDEGDCLPF